MNVKVRNKVTGRKRITYTKKEALYLSKCDHCGKLFEMNKWYKDSFTPGALHGTFDKPYDGNQFFGTVCSFKCAHEIFIGGWKKMKGYKDFAKIGASLVRIELGITSLVLEEEEAIAEWEKKKET